MQGPFVAPGLRRSCPHSVRPARPSRTCVRAAASEEGEPDVAKNVPLISSKETGPLPYPVDEESFEDLMGFKGSAPEVWSGVVQKTHIKLLTDLKQFQTAIVPVHRIRNLDLQAEVLAHVVYLHRNALLNWEAI